jgi:hypothetical protein
VSANPPKNDAWRPYGDVRFVLIRNTGRLKPSRGLILDWKRDGTALRSAGDYQRSRCSDPVVAESWLPRGGRSSANASRRHAVCLHLPHVSQRLTRRAGRMTDP